MYIGSIVRVGELVNQRRLTANADEARVCYHELKDAPTAGDPTGFTLTPKHEVHFVMADVPIKAEPGQATTTTTTATTTTTTTTTTTKQQTKTAATTAAAATTTATRPATSATSTTQAKLSHAQVGPAVPPEVWKTCCTDITWVVK